MSDTNRPWTPGPWRRHEYHAVVGHDGRMVRLSRFALATGYVPDSDDCYANDHLCLAAPDLYEALEELCINAEGAGYYDGEGQRHPVYVETAAARAALAKARGEEVAL